ncbi:M50 family metallopeptidase [Actinomycetospora lutea]|uniref:M50 family metallopeptidase n=1 Tax=Actinomycetospora lutea TaxID=663604 RepID=UPI00236598DC|nr:M50 family metallopeptidase [Actinomycetospora lutea]MDD7936809.1 M50 family metallopeptidase [Actinomycetospora lutea]
MGGLGVNDVPIVGEPIAYGTGFIALLVVCFSTYVARYFYFYATAGGSLLVRVGLARRISGFWLYGEGSVGSEIEGSGGWPTMVLAPLASYLGAPLLGLGGAALIASGNPWAVLLAAVFLSLLALLVARNPLAFTVPLLVVVGLGFALLYGSGEQQAFAAAFVAWFLLLAGAVWSFRIPADKGPSETLPRRTLIPGLLWRLLWIVVAIVALIVGGQLLLRPGYGIG